MFSAAPRGDPNDLFLKWHVQLVVQRGSDTMRAKQGLIGKSEERCSLKREQDREYELSLEEDRQKRLFWKGQILRLNIRRELRKLELQELQQNQMQISSL